MPVISAPDNAGWARWHLRRKSLETKTERMRRSSASGVERRRPQTEISGAT